MPGRIDPNDKRLPEGRREYSLDFRFAVRSGRRLAAPSPGEFTAPGVFALLPRILLSGLETNNINRLFTSNFTRGRELPILFSLATK